MVGIGETTLVVSCERIFAFQWTIGRVEVRERMCAHIPLHFREVTAVNIDSLEDIRAKSDIVGVANRRRFVLTERNIELALAVNAIQAVKTGLVKENEFRRLLVTVGDINCYGIERLTHQKIYALLAIQSRLTIITKLKCFEFVDELLGVSLNTTIDIDECFIAVANDTTLKRITLEHIEKHCSAANKRLNISRVNPVLHERVKIVSIGRRRQKGIELRYKLCFPASPFNKGTSVNSFLFCHKTLHFFDYLDFNTKGRKLSTFYDEKNRK